jgi:hypothetical protein
MVELVDQEARLVTIVPVREMLIERAEGEGDEDGEKEGGVRPKDVAQAPYFDKPTSPSVRPPQVAKLMACLKTLQ